MEHEEKRLKQRREKKENEFEVHQFSLNTLPLDPGCAPNFISSASSSLLVGAPKRPKALTTRRSEYPSFNANSRYCR